MPFNELALRIMGVGIAVSSWSCVAFPSIQIHWKGGNRAPLSRRSTFIIAAAATSWCFGVFRFHPLYFAAVFAACVMFGFFQSNRDRAAHDAARGIGRNERRVLSFAQYWPALCILDGLLFVVSLYALVRDLRLPPHNEEQYIHLMGIGYLVASAIGGIYLYLKRPQTRDGSVK